MKILIAEDDDTSRIMLEAILTKWGYDVESHTNGIGAWRRMTEPGAPQLLILDWVMPEMDGLALCRKLRRTPREKPVYIIILTAHGEREKIIQGLEAGADDYIAKPYDTDELRARLDVGIRIIDLQAELAQKERLKGVLEMAGGVCHELNQPLQRLLGYADILMLGISPGDPKREILMKINTTVQQVAELTHKIMRITRYRTKPYVGDGQQIVDIEMAVKPDF